MCGGDRVDPRGLTYRHNRSPGLPIYWLFPPEFGESGFEDPQPLLLFLEAERGIHFSVHLVQIIRIDPSATLNAAAIPSGRAGSGIEISKQFILQPLNLVLELLGA